MASQKRPSSRKSVGYLPSPNLDTETGDKENVGPDALPGDVAAAITSAKQKKSRSKSLGPGGLDALKEDAGNKRKVYSSDAVSTKALTRSRLLEYCRSLF